MGDWTESKYTETRFGGMDKAVEPHTLDRDGGIMADEFNMMSRTQGLRTRKGWRLSDDLSLYVSSLPGKPKPPLALIGYETNLATVAEDDDDDDDGGDGGNGGVIGGLTGGGDDDDVTPGGGGSGVSLTLTTPQAVVAEVPFAVSSGASAHYTGSNAHLEWSFTPDGQPSVSLAKGIRSGWNDNAWTTTATIWTADRSRTGVTAVLKKGSGVQATKNMGYSVASMIPSLPSSVPYRQDFTLTVSCKLGGAVQTGYVGNGRGVSISWQAFDENDNPVSCHVRCGQTGWTNGVGTYNAYLSSVASTAVKLRAIVTYAGESQTADADISGVGLPRVPSSLHVFGDGGTMRINAVGLTPSALSIVARVDGDVVTLSDYLELAGGTPLDISSGWDGNVWEHDIQAKSSASAATLVLKLMNGQTELASESITIADGLAATIAAAPTPLYPGDDLTATATITATGGTITRLPAEKVMLVISGERDEEALNDADDTEITATYEDVPDGTVVVQVLDMRNSEEPVVLASLTIETSSYQTKLVQAINERLIATNHSDSDLVDEDETDKSVLYAKGNTAMYGFVDGAITINDQGNVVYSTFGNAELPPYENTDDEWYQDAYETVIQAVTKPTNGIDMYPTTYAKRKVGDEQSADTESAAVADALANCNGKQWADYYYFDEDGVVTEMTTSTSGDTHKAKAILKYRAREYRFKEKVACSLDIYAKGNPSFNGTWNTMGHQYVVADKNTTAKIATLTAPANEIVTFLMGTAEDAEARYSGTRNTGYQQYSTNAVFANYNFQHK